MNIGDKPKTNFLPVDAKFRSPGGYGFGVDDKPSFNNELIQQLNGSLAEKNFVNLLNTGDVRSNDASNIVGGRQFDAVVDLYGKGDFISIQDALNAGKKRIFVRAGTYKPFVVTSNGNDPISIIGESSQNVSIQIPNSSADGTIAIEITGTSAFKVNLNNFYVDGNYANQDSGYTQYAIKVTNGRYCIFDNVGVYGVQGYGIYLDSCDYMILKAFELQLVLDDVIYLNESGFNVLTNLYLVNCYKNGIVLNQSLRNQLGSNFINSMGVSASNTYSAILLQGTSTRNKIISNQIDQVNSGFYGAFKYGIREASSADDYNLINNNIIEGVSTEDISTQGPNTIVGDNIII